MKYLRILLFLALSFSLHAEDRNCISANLRALIAADVNVPIPAAAAPFRPQFIANPDNVRLKNTPLDQKALTNNKFKENLGTYYPHVEKLLKIDKEPHVLMGSMEFGKIKLGEEIVANQVGGLGVVINDMINSFPEFLKARGNGKASFVFPGAKEIPHGEAVTEFAIKMGEKTEIVKVEKFTQPNGAEIYFFRNPVFEARSVQAKPSGIYQAAEGQQFSARPEWEDAYFYGLFNKSIENLHNHIGSNIYHGHDHHTALAAQLIGSDTPATVTIHNAGLGYEGRSWAKEFGPGRKPSEVYPQGIPNGPKEDMDQLLSYYGIDFDTYMKYYEERGDFVSLNATKFVGEENLIAGSPVSLGYTDELKMDINELFQTVKDERGSSPLKPNDIYRPNGGRDLGNLVGVQNGLGYNKHASINPELARRTPVELESLHEAISDPKVKELWSSQDLNFGKNLDTAQGRQLVQEKKAILKEMLQRTAGLDVDPNKPMFTLVSRIVDQKNVDVFANNVRHIVENGGQVVIAGLPGDDAGKAVAQLLEQLHNESPLLKKNFKYFNTFANNGLGTLIQGGGDYFVITSKFEPSGLTDIESAWLGNIPLTRNTGGLGKVKNSITYKWADTSDLAGEIKALESSIDEAISLYKNDPVKFNETRIAGMQEDFSWDISYSRYFENYRTAGLFKLIKNLGDDVSSGAIKLEAAQSISKQVIERLPDDMVATFGKSILSKENYTDFELSFLAQAREKLPKISDELMPTGPPTNNALFAPDSYGAQVVKSQTGEVQGAFVRTKFPDAQRVELLSSHDNWKEGVHFLEQNRSNGEWSVYIDDMQPGNQYKFRVINKDGSTSHFVDPVSRNIERDSSGNFLNSVVTDGDTFKWSDNSFKPQPFESQPLVINPDTFVANDHNINFRELAPKLIQEAKAKNATSISLSNLQGRELLKGGDTTELSYFLPNPNHGSSDDFKFLVDELHKNNINVLMDMPEIVKPTNLAALSDADFLKLRIEGTKHLIDNFHIDGVHYSDLSNLMKSEGTFNETVQLHTALKQQNNNVIIASADNVRVKNEDQLGLTARVTNDPLAFMFDRKQMIDFIKETGMPAYLKSTPHGDIPVVLVTKETYPKVKEIMENSYGALASLHPQNATDHGWLRDGNVILDLYNPSERHIAKGEFHETGLAWKTTDEYFSRRNANSKVFFDQTFPLRKEELNDIDYLQRVRRAAFYRNPYAYYTEANGRAYMNKYFYSEGGRATASHVKPHMLDNCGGEHCYTYPLLSQASQQVNQMKTELKQLGINYDELAANPNFKALQDMIREDVLAADAFNPDTFHFSSLLDKQEYSDLLKKVWPGQHTKDETLKALSFVSSIPAIQKHNDLLYSLRNGSNQMFPYTDFNRERSTVFFVYDEDPSAPQRFRDATYTNRGPQNSIDTTGNKKLE